jgi:hypothetical protein
MSNAKISVLLLVQADSLDQLQIFGQRVDDVATEMNTIEVVLIDRNSDATRSAVSDWLRAADETLDDEIFADEDVIPPETTIHFTRLP